MRSASIRPKTSFSYKTNGIILANYDKKIVGIMPEGVKLANFMHYPPNVLHLTMSSWSFEALHLYVVGTLPKSSSGHLYILVVTDYFSKWAEVVSLKEVKKENVANFI